MSGSTLLRVISRLDLKRVIFGGHKETTLPITVTLSDPVSYKKRNKEVLIPSLQSGRSVLIDVREPNETVLGMVPGAAHVPLDSVPFILRLPPRDMARHVITAPPIAAGESMEAGLTPADLVKKMTTEFDDEDDPHFIFYCRSGVRSAAVRIATQPSRALSFAAN